MYLRINYGAFYFTGIWGYSDKWDRRETTDVIFKCITPLKSSSSSSSDGLQALAVRSVFPHRAAVLQREGAVPPVLPGGPAELSVHPARQRRPDPRRQPQLHLHRWVARRHFLFSALARPRVSENSFWFHPPPRPPLYKGMLKMRASPYLLAAVPPRKVRRQQRLSDDI